MEEGFVEDVLSRAEEAALSLGAVEWDRSVPPLPLYQVSHDWIFGVFGPVIHTGWLRQGGPGQTIHPRRAHVGPSEEVLAAWQQPFLQRGRHRKTFLCFEVSLAL